MEAYPPPMPPNLDTRRPAGPARGWLLVVLGTFLSGSMAFLTNWLHQAILHNGEPGARSHWTGGAEFTRTVYGLFGSVFVFGLVAIAAGVYILRTRRISRALAVVMGVVALVMIYLGYTIITTHVPR